jgi:hypothetical protein
MLPEKPMGTSSDDSTGLRGGPDPAWAGLLEEAAGRPGFFFIQIGAADGRIGDPIHHLVERHRWRGILVEPLPHMFAALRATYRHRPDLVLENVAIPRRAPGRSTTCATPTGRTCRRGTGTWAPSTARSSSSTRCRCPASASC